MSTKHIRQSHADPFVAKASIVDDVVGYIKHCNVCQRNKITQNKPYGSLQWLPMPGYSDILRY